MTDKTSADLIGEAAVLEGKARELRSQALALQAEERSAARRAAAEIPVNRDAVQLTDGAPVPADASHTENRGDGQQKGYVVLSPAERAKGFVRPVRTAYRHVGIRPANPTTPLTPEQKERFGDNYVAFEKYPPGSAAVGRYWSERDLNSGCGTVTTMGLALAETYARDPRFYGGTFCCGCGAHFPVGERGEFVWEGTEERVGT